jgi:signal transduction histidine kinase
VGSVGVFVLVGSVALLALFQHRVQHEEAAAFEALAKANAAFLDRTPLPQSQQMARQLGDVMGARVFFWHAATSSIVGRDGDKVDAAIMTMPVDGRVHLMPDGREWMVGHFHRGSSRVFFLRPAVTSAAMLPNAESWFTLLLFWALSCVLAWWLARRVARPLRQLAAAVPGVGGDQGLPPLPVERADEIGQLARALTHTHDSLLDERERRRAAERLALLGRMATSLAHEVRNPVSAIRLHAQLLDGAPPEDAAASAKLIESEAARIESLVSQWMRYAKPGPVVMNAIDMPALVSESIAIMLPQAAHANVTLHAEIAAPWTLQGDRARLLQVLTNLLLNAIQAMPKGGRVTVRVRPGCLEVADEGPGFSAAAIAKLGEPFFSEKEGGMGLGLAVSKEIVATHGGQMQVTNATAGGAVVRLDFPN